MRGGRGRGGEETLVGARARHPLLPPDRRLGGMRRKAGGRKRWRREEAERGLGKSLGIGGAGRGLTRGLEKEEVGRGPRIGGRGAAPAARPRLFSGKFSPN